MRTKIINVTSENIAEHPGIICFINPKHEYFHKKIDWIKDQFDKGLRIKLLYLESEKKPVGFIEYIPGEFCWRAVDAKNHTFIHCLWTNGKKYQRQGLGKMLLDEVEKDAQDKSGIAVVTSDSAFMSTKDIFIKNGYMLAGESGKEQLLVKQFKADPLPKFNKWEKELEKYQGLHMVYSKQCPWVARFIEEVKPVLEQEKLELIITQIDTPEKAQQAPSVYSVFNLIYNGKLLADRYISTTRFKNIVKKEIKSS